MISTTTCEVSSGSAIAGRSILLFTQYYAPEHSGSAPYTTGLAEYLVDQGARVTVIASPPHYPYWQRDRRYGRGWSTEQINGVTVHRVPTLIPDKPGMARRLVYEMSYATGTLPRLAGHRPDLVVGTVPSLFAGLTASVYARLTRRPLVQVVQDLVSSAATQSGLAGASRATKALRRLESFALQQASHTTVPTEAFLPALNKIGLPEDRVSVVRNWSTVSGDTHGHRDIRAARRWEGRFVVLHAGNIGHKQGLEELEPVVRQASEERPDVLFAFVGAGNRSNVLRERLGTLPNVEILPPVEQEQFLPTLAAADALLVHERSTVFDMSLPSKLTSYFAAERPVVAVANPGGATAREVERSGGGVVIQERRPDAFIHGVDRLRQSDHFRESLATAGRRYCTTSLGRERQCAIASSILSQALAKVEGP